MIPFMSKKRRDLGLNKGIYFVLLILCGFARASFAQVDSVWTEDKDTLTLVHKPVVLKEQVVVYVAPKKKKRIPLSEDNHFFISVMCHTQVSRHTYYGVEERAKAYIDKLRETTHDHRLGVTYGIGFGYHTNRWIASSNAMILSFGEKRDPVPGLEDNRSAKNGYMYVGVRAAVGYRFGQNKLLVFPKIEAGFNIYDRTAGKIVDFEDFNKLRPADMGMENDVVKFVWSIRTIGPTIQACYRFDNFMVYLEPYYNYDIDNSIKSNEPFKLKRDYWGCRAGFTFYFF